ncbi:diacylglycerol kinase [Inhella sp.]|uniref:diacylglycerol kinase n=1 Tax=Inhella sp. TaxID=1921806 RepID=UPI0035B09E1E
MNEHPLKSKGGPRRLLNALRYSWQGLRAAFRHEAAFRQELAIALPLLLLTPWVAQGALHALLLVGVWVAVWVVELLNSAIEALADQQSLDKVPLLGRAKDLGSAAVLLTLGFALLVWALALWTWWRGG